MFASLSCSTRVISYSSWVTPIAVTVAVSPVNDWVPVPTAVILIAAPAIAESYELLNLTVWAPVLIKYI